MSTRSPLPVPFGVRGLLPSKPSDPDFDFRRGTQGWASVDGSLAVRSTKAGLELRGVAPGGTFTSPRIALPAGVVAVVSLEVRHRQGDPFATLALGPGFRSDDSRYFAIPTTGRWETVVVSVPWVAGADRLRLQPAEGKGVLELRSIRVRTADRIPPAPWADPVALRGKEIVAAGQWLVDGTFSARWLAANPDFTRSFPYTGLVLPLVLDREALSGTGLPVDRCFAHDLMWTKVPIEWRMLAPEVAALRSTRWRHVRANYLNATFGDASDGTLLPDLRDDREAGAWAGNAAMMGRACREAGLRGIWLDTEQYGRWPGTPGGPFPLGRDTPEVLRRRGAQWIEAVQREFPAVRLIVTFAWSPDVRVAGFLEGVAPFLDGILAGLRDPGRIVHGYENSFYYGWGPGNPYAAQGYDGSHGRFHRMRLGQRDWRRHAADPARHDRFVETGTAAWVEDHPYAPWAGWPEGRPESVWSNLPLAVQHTDRTVWVWSEHTHYRHAFEERRRANPFCFAVANRAADPVSGSWRETFAGDPFAAGWTFDFDIEDAGRKKDPDDARPVFDDRGMPYRWESGALLVESEVPAGGLRPVVGQRLRAVRPVRAVGAGERVACGAEWVVDDLGHGVPPIAVGWFDTARGRETSGFWAAVLDPSTVLVVRSSPGKAPEVRTIALGRTRLAPGDRVAVRLRHDGATGRSLVDVRSGSVSASLAIAGGAGKAGWDEVGVALAEPGVVGAIAVARRDAAGFGEVASGRDARAPSRPQRLRLTMVSVERSR